MDSLKRQIRSMMLEDLTLQGETVNSHMGNIQEQVAQAVGRFSVPEWERIYIVGAGDSYYAGLVTRLAFEKYAGIVTEPVESLEFSRYLAPYASDKGLTIGVSISGQVGRSLDAIQAGIDRGLAAIGITATPGSRIFDLADEVIDVGVRVREPGPVPQTYHFLANIVALYLLALEIGRKRGQITELQAAQVRRAMRHNLESLQGSAEALLARIMAFARTAKNDEPFVIVGGGPNYGTALFGVAKLIEAALISGIPQELEEWAHEQYFITKAGVHTLVMAAPGASYDRALATLTSIRKLGGTAVAISAEGDEEVQKVADVVWPVKMDDDEFLSPMSLKLPLEIFAYALAEVLDRRPFNYDDEVRKKTCEENIYHDGESAETVARKQKQGKG